MLTASRIPISATAITLLLALATLAPAAYAKSPQRQLIIELNNIEQRKAACRLTLLIENKLATRIDKLNLELVLFDQAKRVMKLLSVDAGSFRTGKTRIKQFDLTSSKCATISRILINTITRCDGDQLTPANCLELMQTRSLTSIPLTY